MMYQFHTLVDADLGYHVSNSHYHGTSFLSDLEPTQNINQDRERFREQVSFFKYPTIEEGIHCFDLMAMNRDITNCNYNYLAKIGTRDEVVVVTERLRDLKSWIERRRRMYVREDKRTQGVGRGEVSYIVSEDFIKIFRPIIMFLESLHKKSLYHGNLNEGTFLRSDNDTVCFANFGCLESIREGIIKDFTDLVRLIVDACGGSTTRMPCECYDFEKQVQGLSKIKDLKELKEVCWFLYHHPLFWSIPRTILFVDKVSEFKNRFSALFRAQFMVQRPIEAYLDIGEWWNQLPSSQMSRQSSFWHLKLQYQQQGSTTKIIHVRNNIVVLVRNSLQHAFHGDKDLTMRLFKMIWPYAILIMYREMQRIVLNANLSEAQRFKDLLMDSPSPFKNDLYGALV